MRNEISMLERILSTDKLIRITLVVFLIQILLSAQSLFAVIEQNYVSSIPVENGFVLSANGKSVSIYASSNDYSGVLRVLKHLQRDIGSVTGSEPRLLINISPKDENEILIVGTIGKSSIVERLIKNKKIDVSEIKGKWESYLVQVVDKPFQGANRALVIAGSDKRGTIYGIYDLSEKIGVSPWYWWADVPVKKQSRLYIKPIRYIEGEPKVKYRGIFINDEAPALTGFVKEKFGDYNSKFYEHVFELILRLKGNYLWPAMWDNSFYTDDTLNGRLADEYGIVMGTSHHEPMMRAWKEWSRAGNPPGSWNYNKNADKIRKFWEEGIRRTRDYEKIVTLAMRGDGDEPMSESANIALLQKIVEDQRRILTKVTGKKVTEIPQVWALYKEVQEYYDKGMEVPEDITLLLCDDNWGNIRILPKLNAKPRKGGYGIYYHFDFVGGPRNYKWLNTNQIERVWEQMHLAYEYGARQIWIVNVGDIKPMEFPISFFLDYAWNPEKWTADRLLDYYRLWAKQQFPEDQIGHDYSDEIASILAKYTKFNSRRKPEMLEPTTYSLVSYNEADNVVKEYNDLAEKAQKIYDSLPQEYKDAFYQLVLHPVIACANLNELYVTVGKNWLYAKQGRASANALAEKAKELFRKDSLISYYYNKIMSNGKWNHMMDQTHIGYTSWQQPPMNVMPEVKKIDLQEKASMGVAIEGSENWWPESKEKPVLPEFDPYNKQTYWIDVFNRGAKEFEYSVKYNEEWLVVNPSRGKVQLEERLTVSVNWDKVPKGTHELPIRIKGSDGTKVELYAVIRNPEFPTYDQIDGFVESNGYISMEAINYARAVNTDSIYWITIPNLGRTNSAVTAMPVTCGVKQLNENSPRLEYKVYLFSRGKIFVKAYLSPTLNFLKGEGLRYAISFDNQEPQIINIHAKDVGNDWEYPMWWNLSVSNNIRISVSEHNLSESGQHVLKFWLLDPGIVLQKIVIETGLVRPSYLGPPESFKKLK